MEQNPLWPLAEAYVAGTLPAAELEALRRRLATDAAFATEFNECADTLRSLADSGRQVRFKIMLAGIAAKANAGQPTVVPAAGKTIPLRTHYLRTAGIAASIALVTTLSTYWMTTHSQKKASDQYAKLRRELATIKSSQKQIISNINRRYAAPEQPATYSGTGFAVSQNGYLVTNYHVTEDADSVYIQDSKGDYYRADVVSFDKASDVALLKVAYSKFSFGKGEVPYAVAPSKKGLGARVFTLGFPQDEVVYNEGYISSANGFEGDTLQYQLELPAAYGQSGAPVLDAQGNLIAIVTARQGKAGATYAVSSKAIHHLVRDLPEDVKLSLTRRNKLVKLNREEQIKKLQDYTCAVKVWKKR
jgi:S1-C subfamily serine protease